MGDILFHQVESLGHQVVEFLLAWRSCTTLNAILYWIRIILKFLKICGTKKRSIWHPGFSTAVFKQVAKSQGGDWWMIILDSSDYTGGCGDPAIITSWHPLSVMKCIPLEFWDPIHAWRSSGYFTNSLHREPRSPPVRSVLVFAQWQQSLETTLVSLAGRTVTISWTPWWKCWHRIFLTP